MNERIKAREIRLIDPKGNQVGIMPLKKGLSVARELGMDLVEVAPQARPPVCKIMDYGKFKYEQAKKAKEAKKNQNIVNVKEVQLGVKIEEHDFQVKLRMAQRFLKSKDKVKFKIRFRGREITHKELGYELMNRMKEELKDLGNVESQPKMEGRNMVMVIGPEL
ncbi:MAG: translation initiation factor IF-3 [Halanaerobium sp.]|nr:translation initiation factor IF-3 [Halanaerobium sp.]